MDKTRDDTKLRYYTIKPNFITGKNNASRNRELR